MVLYNTPSAGKFPSEGGADQGSKGGHPCELEIEKGPWIEAVSPQEDSLPAATTPPGDSRGQEWE